MFLKRVGKISRMSSSSGRFDTNVCAISSRLHRSLPLIKVEWNHRLGVISSAAVSILISSYTLGESVISPGDPVDSEALISMYAINEVLYIDHHC